MNIVVVKKILFANVMQWISNESWTLIAEREKVKLSRDQAVSDNMTATLGKKYNDLNKAVKDSCKRDKKQWIETKCQEAEYATAKNDARSLYKILRDLTR